MAMDFFQHQEQARKRTGLLMFYFFLAVFFTIVAVNAALFVIFSWSMQPGLTVGGWLAQPVWLWVSGITLAVIGIGSLTRYLQLREGGHVIADAVHARRIDTDTTDIQERMLLNIVDPSSLVRPEYVAYIVATNDGRVLSGMLHSETVQTVTLIDAKRNKITVARTDIEEIKPSDVSLMPDNLLEPLDSQQLRDLISFLQQ